MYAPDYNIPLPDGRNIALLFNSWTYRTYCQKIGIEYEDLLNNISEGGAFKAKHLPDLFYIASESFNRFNKREFKADELEAYEWLDALGGFASEKLADVYKIFVSKLINVPKEQFEILWNKALTEVGEVKTNTGKKKSNSRGTSSTVQP